MEIQEYFKEIEIGKEYKGYFCKIVNIPCYYWTLCLLKIIIAELGITIGQKSVDGKSNEIPAAKKFLNELNISVCLIVADAMHCQKKHRNYCKWFGGLFVMRKRQSSIIKRILKIMFRINIHECPR